MKILVLLAAVTISTASEALSVIPLARSPGWQSSDVSSVSTGAGWADINGDGYLDLVVANGNDMARQRVAVYYNNGDGTFFATPSWQSQDVDYHGHLSLGDIDQDGDTDLAVSVFLGPAGFDEPGKVKVYYNTGTELEGLPSWQSSDRFFTFSCALGDADGDGDLDLAVATGESYYHGPNPIPNRIYRNSGGHLSTLPDWLSTERDHSFDVAWGDVDNDGDLDLAFTNSGSPNRLYINNAGSVSRTAGWSSTDASQDGNSLTWGDVTGDGWLDLLVADNYQLGGTGKFKMYSNDGTGSLGTTPSWQSSDGGYGSAVALCDVEGDGDLDLATGRWWSAARIYRNDEGVLTTTPAWTSLTSSVIEAMVWADAGRKGIIWVPSKAFTGNGARKLFYLSPRPLQALLGVKLDGIPLPRTGYCYDREAGWLSLSAPPPPGSRVTANYEYSRTMDLAVSNWDSNRGNYIFYHDPMRIRVRRVVPEGPVLSQNSPNPFVALTVIPYTIPEDGMKASLRVFDLRGRLVRELVREETRGGSHRALWDGRDGRGERLTAGVYICTLELGGRAYSRKILLASGR